MEFGIIFIYTINKMENVIDKYEKYDIDTAEFSFDGIQSYARLVDVYDGDTITCVLNIFDNYYKLKFRLYGIDTMEMKEQNVQVKQKALEARKKVIDILCGDNNLPINVSRNNIQEYLKNNIIIVWIECLNFDKYGRILCKAYNKENKNGNDVSSILLECNLAVKYDGGKKQQTLI
jgi:endonuclease YncB( thermonuclease family)